MSTKDGRRSTKSDLNLTPQQQQARLEAVLCPPPPRKTLAWAMKTSKDQPQFLCNAQPPYVVEHVNAKWCELTGFSALTIKGSQGLSLLKGPMTDENVVASAWGTKETSIKVIHYTGGGAMVNHIIHIIPLVAEKEDSITHYLGSSKFEKYLAKGNLFNKTKAVLNTNKFSSAAAAGPQTATQVEPVGNTDAATGPNTATCPPQERTKNIHELRKERALKNLFEYAETLSESVQCNVALTTLKHRPKEDSSGKPLHVPGNVANTADRINAWKSRFNAAKTQAKRERDNQRRGTTSSTTTTASRPPNSSAEGSRGLQTSDGAKPEISTKPKSPTHDQSRERGKAAQEELRPEPSSAPKDEYQETNAISEATAIEEKEDRKGSEEGGVG